MDVFQSMKFLYEGKKTFILSFVAEMNMKEESFFLLLGNKNKLLPFHIHEVKFFYSLLTGFSERCKNIHV